MRHSYSDAQKLRRFMHDSELGHSQALQFFNVSLLTDDFEHKSKCILQITLSTPPIHYLLIDTQVVHFTAENLLLNPFFIFALAAFFCVPKKTWFILHNGLVASFAHRSWLIACFFCFFYTTMAPYSSLNYSFPFCVFYPQCFDCISMCSALVLTFPQSRSESSVSRLSPLSCSCPPVLVSPTP